MISIVILAAALLAQQVSAPVIVTTRVQGTVINSLTGAGVAKATVILRAHDQARAQSYADETDGNGNFSFDDIQPGRYALIAERQGFVLESSGATGAPPPEIKVEQGQQIAAGKIRLTPLGVITGRVLDADGDPVRGAAVTALQHVYSAGKRQLRTIDETRSGYNGDFRLFGLPAGSFYLKASRGGSAFGYPDFDVATYYPATLDSSHAAPVELRAGAQLAGFDIRLQSTRLYSVSFRYPDGHPPEGSMGDVHLENEQGVQRYMLNLSDTGLVFSGVPPGSYEAVVRATIEDKESYAIERVEVSNSDVDGGTLQFLPTVDIAGSVRVEGGPFKALTRVVINGQPQYSRPGLNRWGVEVQPDGSFQLKNMMPTVHQVGTNRVPGVYLKALRMGDKQLADRHIDFASKLEPLVVVLGADVGEVEGSVRNSKGDPVVRARVNVIAYGDHADRMDFNCGAFTNDQGEFRFKSVAPGDYKVFAWEDVPPGAPQDPEFRKPFEQQAVSIKLQPNGHEKVQLTAIAAAQAARSSQ
jgi:hypothetical protein